MDVILRRPRISEKSMGLTQGGLYTFEVGRNATKEQIAKRVAEKFDVTVMSVKTINVKGKTKTQRTKRGYFTVSPIKKAYVQVKKGQKISIFEQAPEDEAEVVTADTDVTLKEKKNLKGTTVKVERVAKEKVEKKKTEKVKTAKQKSIEKKKGAK